MTQDTENRSPRNHEYIRSKEDLLQELIEEMIESLEELTDPEGQDFTCSTCTHIYNMTQEAREELNKIY